MNFQEIVKDHWAEVATNKNIRKLNIDVEKYTQLNELGFLKVFSAWSDDNLVGYATYSIAPHLRYKNVLYAISDVYYLDPNYRGNGAGTEFFTAIDTWLKGLGVQIVEVQEKVKHSHSKLFTSLGYKLIENIYERVL
jgi:GNAT superfamily N-acetyltransferase